MSDQDSKAQDAASGAAPQQAADPHTMELSQAFIDDVREAAQAEDEESLRRMVQDLEFYHMADLLEALPERERLVLINAVRNRFDPNTLTELDDTVRSQVVDQLGTRALAAAIVRLESDDALYLIEQLEEPRRRDVLHAIPEALRAHLEEGLAYPEDSAGRLMQRDVVAVPNFWTVGDTIDFMRESDDLPDDFYDLFVVDPRHRPVGTIPLNRLMRTKRPVKVSEIMESRFFRVPVDMDQSMVADQFRKQDLVSAPVTDDAGRLIGVITADDVMDVITEETEEDLMRLGGVVQGPDLNASPLRTARLRQSWLIITLFNTIIASLVISQFEASIEQIVALAVLMPIVAAMGGNAGMQVVTVTVRALATRELTVANRNRVIVKELLVGAMNGLVFALIMGTIAVLWFGDTVLGMVLGAAMIFNMLWAGFAGMAIPLTLNFFKVDPAVAAGPFLTTTTDVLGFFVFLGLATVVLL